MRTSVVLKLLFDCGFKLNDSEIISNAIETDNYFLDLHINSYIRGNEFVDLRFDDSEVYFAEYFDDINSFSIKTESDFENIIFRGNKKMSGKAYANKKTLEERNKNDYYPTPKVLVVELEKLNLIKKTDKVLECACGEAKQISGYFNSLGYNFEEKDLLYGNDFLKDDYSNVGYDWIVTNPPFSLWDKFVEKSKEIADNVIMIGRTNYFGAYNRYRNGLWNHLKIVYIFDRQIAYDRFDENEMKFKCGCLVTAWFHWDMNYDGKPMIEIMDIQKYLE